MGGPSRYEDQTEDEAVVEDEARASTAMTVPAELVPVVRELIAKHQAARKRKPRGPSRAR